MKKLFSFFLLISSFALVPAAMAQSLDLGVLLHFDKPVAIPGQVLPAGTYRFVHLDDNVNIIRVTDARTGKQFANLQVISASRVEPNDQFEVMMGDAQDGTPALMGWIEAGSTSGYQLLYPKNESRQLSATERTIPAGDLNNSTASGD